MRCLEAVAAKFWNKKNKNNKKRKHPIFQKMLPTKGCGIGFSNQKVNFRNKSEAMPPTKIDLTVLKIDFVAKKAQQMYIDCNKNCFWGLCAIFTLFFVKSGVGQSVDTLNLPATPIFEWQHEVKFVAADHLGQLYCVTSKNEVEKYSTSGQLLARYSNNRLGAASYLDVSNPLKIIVFYKNFRTVEWLDRNLTLLGQMNLEEVGLPMVNRVASALDGHLWVYDEVNFRLKKIAATGQAIFESQPLQFLAEPPRQPLFLQEWGGSVFLWDVSGVFQFDLYAQWRSRFAAIIPADWGAVEGSSFSFFEENRLILMQNFTEIIHETAVLSPFQSQKMNWHVAGKYFLGKTDGRVFIWKMP